MPRHFIADSKDLRQIQRLWDLAGPIAGTPAEAFIAKIGLEMGRLPSSACLRFGRVYAREIRHTMPALIAAGRAPSGALRALHILYLTAVRDRAPFRAPEHTRGAHRGAPARLREAAGPAIVTTSLADGLAVLATTDHAVLVAPFLSELEAGDDVILWTPAATARKVARDLCARGARVRVIQGSAAASLRAGGPAQIAQDLAGAQDAATVWPDLLLNRPAAPAAKALGVYGLRQLSPQETSLLPALPVGRPVADARAHTSALLLDAITTATPDSTTVIRGDMGLGKTRAVLRALLLTREKRAGCGAVIMAVPQTKDNGDGSAGLGREIVETMHEVAQQLGAPPLAVHIYRGRDEETCARYDVVGPLQRARISPSAVCGTRDEKTKTTIVCPFRSTCAYWRQVDPLQSAELIVIPHALLAVPWQKTLLREIKVGLIVIDENFTPAVLRERQITVDAYTSPPAAIKKHKDPDAFTLKRRGFNKRVLDALETGQDPAATAPRTIAAELRAEIDDLLQIEAKITPQISADEARAIAARAGDTGLRTELALLNQLIGRIDALAAARRAKTQLPASRQIELITDGVHGERRRLLRVAWINRAFHNNITPPDERATEESGPTGPIPVLVLDGSAKRAVIERLFAGRQIAWHDVSVALPNARIVQIPDRTNAVASILGADADALEISARAALRLREIVVHIDRIAERHPLGLLVVTPKKVRNAFEKFRASLGEAWPSNVVLTHFGAIRGINRFKNFDAVVVIGRNEPPVLALDGMVAALCDGTVEPDAPISGRLPLVDGVYRTKDGAAYAKKVPHAHGPLARAILETIREDEILQSLARLRLADRPENAPGHVYVMTSIPLALAVDRLEDERAFAGQEHLLVKAARLLGGVLPLSPALLAEAAGADLPALNTEGKARWTFRAAGLVGDDLATDHARKIGGGLLRTKAGSAGYSLIQYRVRGQRGKACFAIVFGRPDPVQALTRFLADHALTLGEAEVLAAVRAVAPVPIDVGHHLLRPTDADEVVDLQDTAAVYESEHVLNPRTALALAVGQRARHPDVADPPRPASISA